MSDKEKFFDDQNVELADIAYIEDQRTVEQDRRFAEIAATYGIFVGGMTLANPSPFVLTVGAGVANDPLGRTLRIITGDAKPLRAAPLSLGFLASDAGKLVTLGYAEASSATSTHPVTGALVTTRTECYPTLHLRTTPAANEVVVGSILAVDISGNATFDLTSTQYWGAVLTPEQLQTLSDAITGIYRHHELDHVSGIERVGAGGDPGAITVNGATTPDEADVTDTVSKDSLLVYNKRIDGAAQLTSRNLKFSGPEVTATAQLWGVYVDVDAVVGKLLLAQYAALTEIPGLQLVDTCPFGVPYPTPLVIEHFKPGGTHFIRIAGQTTISPTSNGLYHLRLDSDPSTGVLIQVTVGSLPSGGSDGSPHQDTIVISDIVEDPPFTINDGVSGGLWLGNLVWSGTALNLLGFGTWATTGAGYDKRNRGNLGDTRIDDPFKTRLTRIVGETRVDGFVSAPRLSAGALTLNVIVQRADVDVATGKIDVTADPNEAFAYFDGSRVGLPVRASFTLPTNSSRCIFLQDNGNGTSTWGIQAGSGSIGVELQPGRMPVWNLETNGTGIIAVQDLIVCLVDIDREAVRMGRKNLGTLELGSSYGDADAAMEPRLRVTLPEIGTVARSVVAAAEISKPLTGFESALRYLGQGWTIHATNESDETASFELVVNAYWDESSSEWKRRQVGSASAIVTFRYFGQLRIYRRESDSADSWTHTFDAAGWDSQILDVQKSVGIFAAAQAQAFFSVTNVLTTNSKKNCSVSISTVANEFTITFDPPMPDDTYVVHVTAYLLDQVTLDRFALHYAEISRDDETLVFRLLRANESIVDIDAAASSRHVNVTVSGGGE